MKKYLIFIFILLCCFGCSARYNLVVNEDMTIEESITGLEDDKFYNNFSDSKSDVIENVLYSINEFLNNMGYSFSEIDDGSMYGAMVSKRYISFDDYSNNSKAYLQLFNSMNVENNNGIITISLNDKVNWNGSDLERYIIDDGYISISVPFKVIDDNADSHSNNKYIWKINSLTDKSILLKFDSNKKSSGGFTDYIIVIIFIICVALIASYFMYVYKKKTNVRNEI